MAEIQSVLPQVDFSAPLNVQEKQVLARIDALMNQFTRKVAQKMAEVAVDNTPIDTSRMVQNWQIGVNQVPEGEIPGEKMTKRFTEKSGTRTRPSQHAGKRASVKKKLVQQIAKATHRDTIYVVNNVPYASKIEHDVCGLHGGTVHAPIAHMIAARARIIHEVKSEMGM